MLEVLFDILGCDSFRRIFGDSSNVDFESTVHVSHGNDNQSLPRLMRLWSLYDYICWFLDSPRFLSWTFPYLIVAPSIISKDLGVWEL
jgi:hypothetical protein